MDHGGIRIWTRVTTVHTSGGTSCGTSWPMPDYQCHATGNPYRTPGSLLPIFLLPIFSPRARFNGVNPRGRGSSLGGEMARRVRPSVLLKPFPKLFPPRTCHVHAFRNDLGGIKCITKQDSVSEFDSGPRCRIRMALHSKAIWPSTVTRTG